MQPFVSVVMANYNGGKYLRRTIESVLTQSYTNLEFIMVDDCSTDNSREIMSEYAEKDPRVRTLFLDKNSQVCVATNRGLAMASGAYIARIDSDDVWRPGKLEKQIAYLEEHPECGGCFTLVDIIDENDNGANEAQGELFRQFDEKNKPQEEWVRSLFFKGNTLCHASSVMPAAVYEKVGNYHPAYLQLQDYHLWCKITAQYPIHIIEERLVEYRRESAQSASLSTMGSVKEIRRFNEDILIHDHYFDQMDREIFIKAFAPYFKKADAKTQEELLCEQAFLKCRPLFGAEGNSWTGIAALEKLLEDPATEKVLEESYGFTAKSFYDISRQYTMQNAFLAQFLPREYQNEITLFFDRGQSFGTGDMLQKRYTAIDGRLEMELTIPTENLQNIRLDLLEGSACAFRDVKLTMNGQEILPWPANGRSEGDKLLFATTDPIIIFPYKEEYGDKLQIEAQILTAGGMEFDGYLGELIGANADLTEKADALALEAEKKAGEIATLQAEIENLKASLAQTKETLKGTEENLAETESMMLAMAETIGRARQEAENGH